MKTNNRSKATFNVDDINWDELAEIGIIRDELELEGYLEPLLLGEKTGIITLRLVLLGVDLEMDATLQITGSPDSPLLEIDGIKPSKQ